MTSSFSYEDWPSGSRAPRALLGSIAMSCLLLLALQRFDDRPSLLGDARGNHEAGRIADHVDVVEDVVRGRLLALRRHPALAHADEDSRIAPSADVEDLVGELALLRAEVDHERRDEVGIEGAGEAAEQRLGEARRRD